MYVVRHLSRSGEVQRQRCKIVPVLKHCTTKTIKVVVEEQPHVFLTMAWLNVSDQLHLTPALTTGTSPRYPLDRGLGGPEPTAAIRNILPLPDSNPGRLARAIPIPEAAVQTRNVDNDSAPFCRKWPDLMQNSVGLYTSADCWNGWTLCRHLGHSSSIDGPRLNLSVHKF
jgi:hypothetical protein